MRIKKRSELDVYCATMQGKVEFPSSIECDPKKSLLDQVFENIFTDALNDPDLDDILEKMEKEETPLACLLDESPSVGIGAEVYPCVSQVRDGDGSTPKRDYSNFEAVILNDEFQEVTEIIM